MINLTPYKSIKSVKNFMKRKVFEVEYGDISQIINLDSYTKFTANDIRNKLESLIDAVSLANVPPDILKLHQMLQNHIIYSRDEFKEQIESLLIYKNEYKELDSLLKYNDNIDVDKLEVVLVDIISSNRIHYSSIENISVTILHHFIGKVNDIVILPGDDYIVGAIFTAVECLIPRCAVAYCNSVAHRKSPLCYKHTRDLVKGSFKLLEDIPLGTECIHEDCTEPSILLGFCKEHIITRANTKKFSRFIRDHIKLDSRFTYCTVCGDVSYSLICDSCISKPEVYNIVTDKFNIYAEDFTVSPNLRLFLRDSIIFGTVSRYYSDKVTLECLTMFLYSLLTESSDIPLDRIADIIADLYVHLDCFSPSVYKKINRDEYSRNQESILYGSNMIRCRVYNCKRKPLVGENICEFHKDKAGDYDIDVLMSVNSAACLAKGCKSNAISCSLCKDHLIYAVSVLGKGILFKRAYKEGKLYYHDLDSRDNISYPDSNIGYSGDLSYASYNDSKDSDKMTSFSNLDYYNSKISPTTVEKPAPKKKRKSSAKVVRTTKTTRAYTPRKINPKVSLSNCKYFIEGFKLYVKGTSSDTGDAVNISLFGGYINWSETSSLEYADCEDFIIEYNSDRLLSVIDIKQFVVKPDGFTIDKFSKRDIQEERLAYLVYEDAYNLKYKIIKKSSFLEYYNNMVKLASKQDGNIISSTLVPMINNEAMTFTVATSNGSQYSYSIYYRNLSEDIHKRFDNARKLGKVVTKISNSPSLPNR